MEARFASVAISAGARASIVGSLLAVAVGLVFGGCASVAPMMPFAATQSAQQRAEEIEPILETAGFRSLPATTSEQKRRLAALPPLKVGSYIDQHGRANFWMADPDYCACLFHGDEAAYQRYEQLKMDDMQAEHDRQAMQARRQPPPGMLGPFGPMGPPGPGISFGGGGFGFSL
ncbi:MAG TPA: hypothetical protein VJN94_15675 [Candidatus Binataceae bacterium]|nr:hypothetical protein [Candidatus Binataceae bacterium]